MAGYDGFIADVDVHHRSRSDAEVVEYLPKHWQAYVNGNGRSRFPIDPPTAIATITPYDGKRADSFPPDGSRPGASYEMLRDQLLNRHPYYRALLLHDVGPYARHMNPYFASALCSAVNDWNFDTWMKYDDRLRTVALVPIATPEEAVAELRRVGTHPRVDGMLVAGNPTGRALGDPCLDPVWKTAAELDLTVIVHPTSTDGIMLSAGGHQPKIESLSQYSQQAMHYISSLIVHGTFEKFPNLRFVITEFGSAWLPYVIWRLDQNYELLRLESPWVKRWPSEYIHDFIKLSTQPIEESPDERGATAELLTSVDGMEDMLCFSSDYPHHTMDDPTYVARILPAAWHRKVFLENACASFRWTVPAERPAALSRPA